MLTKTETNKKFNIYPLIGIPKLWLRKLKDFEKSVLVKEIKYFWAIKFFKCVFFVCQTGNNSFLAFYP